ncbi:MAG: phosphotransferase, partial [Bacteroidota bacterium]
MNPPSTQQIAAYLSTYYDIEAEITLLAGEVDYNYYLEVSRKEKYLLKISRTNTPLQSIDFQTKILLHLEKQTLPFSIPSVVKTKEGKEWTVIAQGQYLRLQTWVEGNMLNDWKRRSPKLFKNWGIAVAQLNLALKNFDHPEAHRFYKWNPSETLNAEQYSPYFTSEHQQKIAHHFWRLFESQAQPQLKELRRGLNYNDAHELNLLTNDDQQISGIIDFGDALHTETINELAIACAYACMGMSDPIQAAMHVIEGFHSVLPLIEEEVKVLFPMIAARLMITVANAAWNKHQEPENEYLLVSEKPAWDLIEKLYPIAPNYAHYCFRAACGWEANPNLSVFQNWLSNSANTIHS